MAEADPIMERIERVLHRYDHAHGKRVFMIDNMREMFATEFKLPRCEFERCGNAGVRTIMVDGYAVPGAEAPNIVARELACREHVSVIISQKRNGYTNMGLKVPDMWHVATEV